MQYISLEKYQIIGQEKSVISDYGRSAFFDDILVKDNAEKQITQHT